MDGYFNLDAHGGISEWKLIEGYFSMEGHLILNLVMVI